MGKKEVKELLDALEIPDEPVIKNWLQTNGKVAIYETRFSEYDTLQRSYLSFEDVVDLIRQKLDE